jgi:AAA domain-containing protein
VRRRGGLDLQAARALLDRAADAVGRDASRDITNGLAAGAANPLVPELEDFGPTASSTTTPKGCGDGGGTSGESTSSTLRPEAGVEEGPGAPAGAVEQESSTEDGGAGEQEAPMPPWRVPFDLAQPPRPRKYLVDLMVPANGFVVAAGAPGTLKSIIALDLVRACVQGGYFLGCKVLHPGDALLLDTENDPHEDVLPRVHALTPALTAADLTRVHFRSARGMSALSLKPGARSSCSSWRRSSRWSWSSTRRPPCFRRTS